MSINFEKTVDEWIRDVRERDYKELLMVEAATLYD